MNFQKNNLSIDWISFNISDLRLLEAESIASHLSELGFNSSRKKNNGKQSPWLQNPNHEFEVLFTEYHRAYWSGTIISFSGENAAQFYHLVTLNRFNWKVFEVFSSNLVKLGRIDIDYLYPIKLKDSEAHFFLRKCYQFIREKKKKRSVKLENDQILRINQRTSPNFHRIYLNREGLKFEIKIKKQKAQLLEENLFANKIKEFETQVTEYVYDRWSQLLPYKDKDSSSYLEWILSYQRTKQNPKLTENLLVSSD